MSDISFASIIALMTTIFTVLVKVVGLPSQAKRIHKTKDVKGISITLFLITFLSYCFWTIHGIVKGDNVIIYGQGLGILTTGFILGQIIYYKRKKTE